MSKRLKKIILALLYVIAPEEDGFSLRSCEEKILTDVHRMILCMPKLNQRGLRLGIYLFDFLSLFSFFKFKRFVSLNLKDQKRYVTSWEESVLAPKREFFKAMRALILVVGFSQKPAWDYIDYHPEVHLDERLKMRQDLLEKKS